MDVASIKKWQSDMQAAVEGYFGPNSRTSLSVGDNLGFARLHLTGPINDEDEFLAVLPPNKRSIVTTYHDKASSSLVYEFTPLVEPIEAPQTPVKQTVPQQAPQAEKKTAHQSTGKSHFLMPLLTAILSVAIYIYSQDMISKISWK